jgi:hypothetical protein
VPFSRMSVACAAGMPVRGESDDDNDRVGSLPTLCKRSERGDEDHEQKENQLNAMDPGGLHASPCDKLKITAEFDERARQYDASR